MKTLKILTMATLAMILLTACPPPEPDPAIVKQINNCFGECRQQVAQNNREYNQCLDDAYTEYQAALERCGQFGKVEVAMNCIQDATDAYNSKRQECRANWEGRNDELAGCGNRCWTDFVGTTSTEKDL